MIATGTDCPCGHPMVQDNPGEPARCAVCTASASWHWETWPSHPHNMKGAA